MPDTWKAGERVRITSTGAEGYVATIGEDQDTVITVQTDEANVHAVYVYLRETTQFTLVPLSGLERIDIDPAA